MPPRVALTLGRLTMHHIVSREGLAHAEAVEPPLVEEPAPATLKAAFRPGHFLDVTTQAAPRGFTTLVGLSRLIHESLVRQTGRCPCEPCEMAARRVEEDRVERLLAALETAIVGADDGATRIDFFLDVPDKHRTRRLVPLTATLTTVGGGGPLAIVVTRGGEVHDAATEETRELGCAPWFLGPRA